MKSVLEFLEERKEMAWHNRLCCSENYGMDSPGKGKEDEFAEAVRDCEIVEQLFALAMEKETAESTQDKLPKLALRFFSELTNNKIRKNAEGIEISIFDAIEKKPLCVLNFKESANYLVLKEYQLF